MRIISLIAIVLALAIQTQGIYFPEIATARPNIVSNGKIKGKGKVITKTRNLESFEEIHNNGIFNVKIVQSNESKVEIRVHENIMQYVATEVKDGILSIYFDYDGTIDASIHDIVVYTPNCKVINNITIGKISCDKLTSASMKVINEGIGKVDLNNVTADKIEIINEGIGELEIKSIEAKKISVSNEGLGKIRLSGNVDEAYYSNEGIGRIDAAHLTASKIDASNEGIGNIDATSK